MGPGSGTPGQLGPLQPSRSVLAQLPEDVWLPSGMAGEKEPLQYREECCQKPFTEAKVWGMSVGQVQWAWELSWSPGRQ